MKQILLALLLSLTAIAQTTQPTPLRVYHQSGITATTVIDNRSVTNRALTYVSVACSGSSTWDVALNYSSSSSGPWTSYGSGSTIDESSTTPIAYGFLLNAPNYIQIEIASGSPTCKLSGTLNFYVNAAAPSVSFPVALANGGTGATTASGVRTNIGLNLTGIYTGNGTTPAGLAAGSQLQYLQRKANQTSTTYEFTLPIQTRSQDYDWSYTNGGQASADLSATGTKTITLTPCPLGIYGANPFTSITSQSRLTSIVDSANLATINFTSEHGLLAGDYIRITGTVTDTDLNGTYVVASVIGTVGVYAVTVVTANVTDGTYTPSGSNSALAVEIPFNYIRISGGTGTAETQPLQVGGTCTPGASSGTIVVNTAQTHTGSWSVASATAGIQEASLYTQTLPNGGEVRLPNGNVTVYATTVLLSGLPITIRGSGPWATAVIADTSVTTKDIFYCAGPDCITQFFDFTVAGHSGSVGGAGIRLKDNSSARPKISNVRAADTYGGFWVNNSDYVQIIGSYADQTSNTNMYYGIKVDGLSSDVQVIGGRYAAAEINVPTMMDYGMLITGGDGIAVEGAMFRGNIGIGIEGTQGAGLPFIGSVFIQAGTIIDRPRSKAIYIITFGTPSGNDFFGEIYINGTHIAGDTSMETDDLVYIDTRSLGTVYSGISITSSKINNSNRNGIYALGVNGLNVSDNRIVNNDVDNTGGDALKVASATKLSIVGNSFLDTRAVALQDYGVNLSGTIDGMNMVGNYSSGNASAPYNDASTMSNSVVSNNSGASDLIPIVSAASTLTLPNSMGDTYRVAVGTGAISIINTPRGNGDTRKFLCDAAITFTASASTWGVKSTLSATSANQVVTCTAYSSDSKWYCR